MLSWMETELDRECLEMFGRRAHPEANRLLPDSRFFWFVVDDDRVHDAATDFAEWRAENPDAPVSVRLGEIAEQWDHPTVYDETILSDEQINARRDADPHQEVDFYQAVCVLDATIIATAFCDFFLSGQMDQETRRIAALAIRRELHPVVLARHHPDSSTAQAADLGRLLKLVS
jgi:hypothetical protein